MLKLPRFVFINGPSNSGKSTLAKLICGAVPTCWPEAFAEPVREMIYNVFFPEDGPLHYNIDLKDGAVKQQDLPTLAKIVQIPDTERETRVPLISVRRVMIDFAEEFMKPRFGDNIFGRLLWKRCQEQYEWYSHFIIDDSGFIPEAQYVIDQSSPADCLLLRLHRNGCSFAGDSRSYITLNGVRTLDLHNDGAATEMLDALQLEFGTL